MHLEDSLLSLKQHLWWCPRWWRSPHSSCLLCKASCTVSTSISSRDPNARAPLYINSYRNLIRLSLLHKTNQTQVSPHKTLCAHAQYTSALLHCTFPFQPKLLYSDCVLVHNQYILTATKISRLCACAQSVFHVITKVFQLCLTQKYILTVPMEVLGGLILAPSLSH